MYAEFGGQNARATAGVVVEQRDDHDDGRSESRSEPNPVAVVPAFHAANCSWRSPQFGCTDLSIVNAIPRLLRNASVRHA